MGIQYPPDVQEQVNKKIEAGVSASTAESSDILREIHTVAFSMDEPDFRRLPRIMAMFATLTVSLSIKADRIQRWMIGLTVAIAIMTAVLIVLTCVLIFRP